MLDKLDVNDRHYDRKYQDMQERMDNLYDRISELKEMLSDVETKISASCGEQITGKQIYQFLLEFDKIYGKMTDLEKKEFMRTFIKAIELYPERDDSGRIIKQISFKFPVYYNGCEGDTIRLPKENTVETVVLLSKLNTKQHIEVELNLDELDLTAAESKATYDEIKAYVLEKYGLKVSSLYISQVKRKCGLDVGQNYNLSKKEDAKVPQCPPEKEAAIMDALKHFHMV